MKEKARIDLTAERGTWNRIKDEVRAIFFELRLEIKDDATEVGKVKSQEMSSAGRPLFLISKTSYFCYKCYNARKMIIPYNWGRLVADSRSKGL